MTLFLVVIFQLLLIAICIIIVAIPSDLFKNLLDKLTASYHNRTIEKQIGEVNE